MTKEDAEDFLDFTVRTPVYRAGTATVVALGSFREANTASTS